MIVMNIEIRTSKDKIVVERIVIAKTYIRMKRYWFFKDQYHIVDNIKTVLSLHTKPIIPFKKLYQITF